MNKTRALLLLASATLLLSACTEKKQYEQTVLAQLQNEPDIKDYKLDPALMTDCVVQTTSHKMPGLFSFDPDRIKAYVAYTKMLTLSKAKDPQQVMTELRTDFGSAQGLLEARNNYAESLVECQTGFITDAESDDAEKIVPEAVTSAPVVESTPPAVVPAPTAAAPVAATTEPSPAP